MAKMKVKELFCPKCKSTDVYSDSNAESEWSGEMEIVSREGYVCNNPKCGHVFEIAGSYRMTEFNFVNDEYMDDQDIEVGE